MDTLSLLPLLKLISIIAQTSDLDTITHTIARRLSRYAEKAGYLVRDVGSAYLDLQADNEDAMANIVGASVTYRLYNLPPCL
ncbi:MAG: hypothetical protein QGD92_14545 [Gammaproteobacteria bacterium]|nr:hypothetical protein [Gammaproteobacteria bacterium]